MWNRIYGNEELAIHFSTGVLDVLFSLSSCQTSERPSKNHGEERSDIPVRVAVEAGGSAVGSPTSVRNTSVGLEGLGHVGLSLRNELLQFGHLANFLECADLILLVAIHGHTG